ncbi:MAG: hypothetical protein M1831_003932 [Alyxoria varia]|nr:MAG: hypothetical protein M1831_003932 [Alyxoria varia]
MATNTAAPRSPSGSPRLPSPPPIAEDQTAPISPMSSPRQHEKVGAPPKDDQTASRRIRPGTKAESMNEGPPLIELSEIDSAFQLTEHLKALHHSYTHPPALNITQPITRSTASLLASVPQHIDRSLWLYELCRFLVQHINIIITSLFADTPPCSAATCAEMRASEWQYLCAVHDPPKSCCAIDYCCHTLDWAANTLTSPKHFPSRLALGTSGSDDQRAHDGSNKDSNAHIGGGGKASGVSRQHQERHLTNIFRRVYRIFAHAWFQHREIFWRVEGRTGLYVMFKTVCDAYNLIPDDNYTIPPEAEGLESSSSNDAAPEGGEGESAGLSSRGGQGAKPPGILKREGSQDAAGKERGFDGEDAGMNRDSGATARRHRHAPSRSGTFPATVMEEGEEEDSSAAAAQQRAAAAAAAETEEHKPSHRSSESVIIAKPEDPSTTNTTTTAAAAEEDDTPTTEQQKQATPEEPHIPVDPPPTIEAETGQETTPEPWKTADPDAADAIGAPKTEDAASSIVDVNLEDEDEGVAAPSPSLLPPEEEEKGEEAEKPLAES